MIEELKWEASSLLRGLETQARVIFALALRETRTRFGQHRLGYVWALVEPSVVVGLFATMMTVVGRLAPERLPLIPFLVTGLIPYELSVKSAERVAAAIDGNKAMLFYPHVQPIDLIAARVGLEFSTYAVVFTILIGAHAAATQTLVLDDILPVAHALVMASMLGASLGTVLCALRVVAPVVQQVSGPLMRPLFWMSGIFFTANMVPLQYRSYFLWNPILHCVEVGRTGFFEAYTSIDADPKYVWFCIICLFFIGLTLERWVRPKVQLS